MAEEKEKKGFFRRLVDGLTKTRKSIAAGFEYIFNGFTNIDDDFYITLSNDMYILFYDSYTRFNYRFMYHLSLVWVDSYTIDKSSYLTMTIRDNNFIVTTDKIRGKTIHKKGKS